MYFRHQDVTYVHAPKIGSTSILGWFLLLKSPHLYKTNPEYFKQINTEDHSYRDIRFNVERVGVLETAYSFVVVRDPVERFLSGYKNRVLTHRQLDDVDKHGRPDFDYFVKNFQYYYDTQPTIKTHFRPFTQWYGNDKTKYTHTFRTEKLDECRQWLSEHFNQELPKLHLQQNKPNAIVHPTDEQIEIIKDFYKKDYENGWN